MSVCRVHLKSGQTIELRGSDFAVTSGSVTGEFRKLSWTRAKSGDAEILWMDAGSVSAVVVSDK